MFSRPDVVKGCQQQNPQAQAALYTRYKGRLMGVCQRYARTTAEAEDIFQEAFLKIFSQIHKLNNPEALDSWVRTLVIRAAVDHYQSTRRDYQLTSADEAEAVAADELDVLGQLSLEEITDLIQHLPTGCRLVVNLYLIDGYEHHEIAGLLGIAEGTSKSQLARGKYLLQRLLRQKGILRYDP